MDVAARREAFRRAGQVVAFAVGYYALARLSYIASLFPPGALAVWWAPSGLALGALVRAERRLLPWLCAATAGCAALINSAQPIDWITIAYRSVADVLEPLSAALLLRHLFGRGLDLSALRQVLAFIAIGGMLGPAVGALTVFAGAAVHQGSIAYAFTFSVLWFGSAVLGAVLFAPLILTWRPPFGFPRGRRLAEAASLGAVLVAASMSVFLLPLSSGLAALIGFAAFPPLAWAAGRFGPKGTARSAVALSLLSLWPLITRWPDPTPLQIIVSQGIYSFGVLTALALSALSHETQRLRERAEAQALRAEESLKLVERALREARDAVQVREDFLSIASHELKTPLTPLAVRLSYIRKKLEAGQPIPPDAIDKPLQGLRKLTELINDLLDASRIEHGRLMLHREPQPLDELVRQCADPLRGVSSKHRLVVDVPAEPIWVNVDRQRMAQVITNLLDNAIKYSPAGGEVRVSVRPMGDEVELIVSDQGIGIPPGQRERLFERFYRAENANLSFGGLGLGLYITRDIVDRHGGRIWADSEPGRGSTFHVVLPRIQPEQVLEALH